MQPKAPSAAPSVVQSHYERSLQVKEKEKEKEKGGGYRKIETPLILYWNQKVAVDMATE